jgi:UDP-N-acetylmuramyl pentapeptide phosphotransferase/UDP-N-acetylglucosamine-1-phosphate transferase
MSRATRRSALIAAAVARMSYSRLSEQPPGGAKTWTRTNHRGEPITLLEGPAVVLGAIAGSAMAEADPAERLALVVAGAGAGGFGAYDDLAGDRSSRGFRGHIGALARGELSTGAVKLAGIGLTGLAAAAIAGRARERQPAAAAIADVIIDAGLVAGGANLLNLFDLRPGRAVKVAAGTAGALAVLPGSGGDLAAAPVAAALALQHEDLQERSMLGDAGANAIGAMLGVAATRLPRSARIAALAGIVSLTAASEFVSFTRVIERTPVLHWLDMLGRRPADPADQRPSSTPAATGDAGSAAEERPSSPAAASGAGSAAGLG